MGTNGGAEDEGAAEAGRQTRERKVSGEIWNSRTQEREEGMWKTGNGREWTGGFTTEGTEPTEKDRRDPQPRSPCAP
jgi:hypothetical protein